MAGQESLTISLKKESGSRYGKFRFLPKLDCFCGSWRDSLFLLAMFFIIEIWLQAAPVRSVGWRILGSTHFWTKCVWALEKDEITDLIGELQEQGARAWLSHVFSELANDDLVRVVVMMWAIWYARRKAIHEAAFQSPLSTHNLISHYIADLEPTKPTPREDKQVQYQCARWIPLHWTLLRLTWMLQHQRIPTKHLLQLLPVTAQAPFLVHQH